jgi:predicted ATP-grasp superfamily ATP-dependent carboligase
MNNNRNKNPAVVLNSKANGLGIIHSLVLSKYDIPIVTIDKERYDFGSYSKYVKKKYFFKNEENFKSIISDIYDDFDEKIVFFPSGNDYFYDILLKNYDDLKNISYIPVNKELVNLPNKTFQMKKCLELNIPVPNSICSSKNDFMEKSSLLNFPILVKPITRKNLVQKFRNAKINNFEEAYNFYLNIDSLKVDSFLISEIIPGNSSKLWTYGSYYDNGAPLGEFVGRKLTQYPEDFGVGCILENRFNKNVLSIGRKLLRELKYTGVSQVELKFDSRDKRYKLIEINPRSWLWAKLATISGVNLPLIQYYWMTKRLKIETKQKKEQKYMVIFPYIIKKIFERNLFDVKFYIKNYKKTTYAIWNKNDINPFLISWVKAFIPTHTQTGSL